MLWPLMYTIDIPKCLIEVQNLPDYILAFKLDLK